MKQKAVIIVGIIGVILVACITVGLNEREEQSVVPAAYSTLLDAIEYVESKGNTKAIGQHGEVGCMQISKICIDDVNRIYTMDFKYNDRYSRNKSRQIAVLYLKYYGGVYAIKNKTQPTDETLSRIWNGGPVGYKKHSTIRYWNKVRSRL